MSFCKEVKNIYYSPGGDFIEYFYTDKIPPYYAESLDFYITLLRDQETDDIIGIQLQVNGIKKITKEAKKETKKWMKVVKNQDKEIEKNLTEIFK